MKLILIILFFPISALCQTDSALTYSSVEHLEGSTREQLFIAARNWFSMTFKDAKAVLTISDKETGELTGNGVINSIWHFKQLGSRSEYPAKVEFVISIWVKDGRYKYLITNLYSKNIIQNSAASKDFGLLTSADLSPIRWQGISQKKMDETWRDLKKETDLRVRQLLVSLTQSMKSKIISNDF